MDNNSHRITVALRVYSQSMTVSMISDILQTQPTQCFDKGTPISPRSSSSKLRAECLWIYKGAFPTESDFSSCISTILEILERNSESVNRFIHEMQMDLFCGVNISIENATNSFSLDTKLIKRIANFPLDLLIDILPD